MLIATRSFSDPEAGVVTAGITRVSEEHELVRRHPNAFAVVKNRHHAATRDLVRAVEGDGQTMTATRSLLPLEEELARREAWLAELQQRSRRNKDERQTDRFWDEVEGFLGDQAAGRAEAAADAAEMDAVDELAPRTITDEVLGQIDNQWYRRLN